MKFALAMLSLSNGRRMRRKLWTDGCHVELAPGLHPVCLSDGQMQLARHAMFCDPGYLPRQSKMYLADSEDQQAEDWEEVQK